MNDNRNMMELEQALETDLRRAHEQLESGLAQALGELDRERAELGDSAGAAAGEMRELTRRAEGALEQVQARLGEFNYVLAEGDLGDLPVFDRYRDRVLDALERAHQSLRELEERGAQWCSKHPKLARVWESLSARVDTVDQSLQSELEFAASEFAAERGRLASAQAAGHADPPKSGTTRVRIDLMARLRSEYQQLLPGIKAIFMYEGRPGDLGAAPNPRPPARSASADRR